MTAGLELSSQQDMTISYRPLLEAARFAPHHRRTTQVAGRRGCTHTSPARFTDVSLRTQAVDREDRFLVLVEVVMCTTGKAPLSRETVISLFCIGLRFTARLVLVYFINDLNSEIGGRRGRWWEAKKVTDGVCFDESFPSVIPPPPLTNPPPKKKF